MNKGFIYAICASFCYSIMSFLARFASEASPIVLIFFRSVICLLILAFFLKKGVSFKIVNKKLVFFRFLFGFLYLVCFYYTVKKLLFVVDAVTLASFSNLFVPLILFFWDGIRVPFIRVIAAFLGFVGILLILKPSFLFFNIFGIIGLLSGLFLGLTKVIIRKLSNTESYQIVILYFFVGSIFISFFPTVYHFRGFENQIMWIYVLLLGIFSFLYQLFNTKAFFCAPSSKVSVLYFSTIMFTGLIEWLVYKKAPGLLSSIGFLLIVIGGFLACKKEAGNRIGLEGILQK